MPAGGRAMEPAPGVADESGPALSARQRRLAAIRRDYLASQPSQPGLASGAGAADCRAAAATDEASPAQALRLLVWAAGLSSLVEGVGDADLSRVLAERLDVHVRVLLLEAGAEAVLEGLDDELLRAVRTGTSWRELEYLCTAALVVHVHPVVRTLDFRRHYKSSPLPVACGVIGNANVRHLVLANKHLDQPMTLRLLLRGMPEVECVDVNGFITPETCHGFFGECMHLAPTLRELDIKGLVCTPARAEGLTELLLRCHRLTSLRIRHFVIDEDTMATVARGFAGSASLRSLDLEVECSPAVEAPLAQAIRDCSTLETFSLEVTDPDQERWAGSHLASAIEHCSCLRAVAIACLGAPESGKSLARAIQANRAIKRVKLRVWIGQLEGRDPGVELLLAKSTTAEMIACPGSTFEDGDLQDFAESLADNTELTELRLMGMTASEAGLAHLAAAVERNTTLRVLEIDCHDLAPIPLSPLAIALRVNSSVTDLTVELQADADAPDALFATLEVNTTLRSVHIAMSRTAPVSGMRLAAAIRNNSTLTSATLTEMAVDAESADAIAEAVAVNSSLRRLSFEVQTMHSELLGQTFARGAAGNTTLTELHLRSVTATEPMIDSIATLIESNAALTTLELGRSWLTEPALTRLSRAIRCNSTLTKLHTGEGRLGTAAQLKQLADAVRVHHGLQFITMPKRQVLVSDYAELDAALSESRQLADHWWRRRGLVLWLRSHR